MVLDHDIPCVPMISTCQIMVMAKLWMACLSHRDNCSLKSYTVIMIIQWQNRERKKKGLFNQGLSYDIKFFIQYMYKKKY